jgi:hypothetical protein
MRWRWPSSVSSASVFCPVCKSEYRAGFTKCFDCGVELVDTLPEPIPSNVAADIITSELLWSGEDLELSQVIAEFLENSKIPFEEGESQVGTMKFLGPATCKIWIKPGDRAGAQEAVAEAIRYVQERNREEALREEQDETMPRDPERPDEKEFDLGAFNPDEATEIVWKGENPDIKDMLSASLREIGIGSVVNESGPQFTLSVEHDSLSRAKEIVREVIDQTPPE